MNQTPAHDNHNPDLLKLIPIDALHLIEVGCSAGAMAREFKKLSPSALYHGIEIDPGYAKLAQRHCDTTEVLDIETVDDSFFETNRSRDCWIFGDTLEHTKNPLKVLQNIRRVIPDHGSICACIPNMQHWSIQVRLSVGDLRYADSGLLDRTHLRWFTRQTIFELFNDAGFRVVQAFPRIFNEPNRNRFLPAIKMMAELAGANPDVAISDALPLQYVLRAIPAANDKS